jgi:hypothetical protein
MDQERIDHLARRVAAGASRRSLVGLAGLGLAALAKLTSSVGAKKKKKKKVSLCLAGQTVQVPKKKVKKFRKANPGAVMGACQGPCIPITCVAQGIECGPLADGCGGTLQCGACGDGVSGQILSCVAGACKTCSGACPGNTTYCFNTIEETTLCTAEIYACFPTPCERDADCPPDENGVTVACVVSITDPATNGEFPPVCPPDAGKGVCALFIANS